MWPKFDNSGIPIREIIPTSIRIWPEKSMFLNGALGSSTII